MALAVAALVAHLQPLMKACCEAAVIQYMLTGGQQHQDGVLATAVALGCDDPWPRNGLCKPTGVHCSPQGPGEKLRRLQLPG
jgi:hypothetical protein